MTLAERPPRVVIDCDTGIDDALALVYLAGLHSAGEVELVAATTSAGNTTVGQAAANTRHVLDLCGLGDVPVYAGEPAPREVQLTTTPETHGPSGLGYAQLSVDDPVPAASAGKIWHEAAATHLIITGPATNAARWFHLGGSVDARMTVMGGSFFYPGNTTPVAEWNSWVDPQGAAELYAWATTHNRKVTVCALGLTEQFTVTPEELSELRAALGETSVAKLLDDALRWYFEFHRDQGQGYLAQVHDVMACMVALDRIDWHGREATVRVDCREGITRGMTIADLRCHWGMRPNATIATRADIDAAHRELVWAASMLTG